MKLLPFIGALLLSTAPAQACEELDEVCITSDVALTTSPQSAITAGCLSPISCITQLQDTIRLLIATSEPTACTFS